MLHTFTFTHIELGALIDALKKGASRHDSYAKFYPGQKEEQHKAMSVTMKQLLHRLEAKAPLKRTTSSVERKRD